MTCSRCCSLLCNAFPFRMFHCSYSISIPFFSTIDNQDIHQEHPSLSLRALLFVFLGGGVVIVSGNAVWSQTHYAVQAGLELLILLPPTWRLCPPSPFKDFYPFTVLAAFAISYWVWSESLNSSFCVDISPGISNGFCEYKKSVFSNLFIFLSCG